MKLYDWQLSPASGLVGGFIGRNFIPWLHCTITTKKMLDPSDITVQDDSVHICNIFVSFFGQWEEGGDTLAVFVIDASGY